MNTFTLFSIEIVISLSMSFITLWILAKPLVNVLEDLCPTKKQAEFCAALTAGFITFVALMWMSVGKFDPFYYVIVFWSLVCGYAFMKGYKGVGLK